MRVLFVDENKVSQHVAKMLFDEIGLDVHAVNSETEAVDALQTERYELIFVDCQMYQDGNEKALRTLNNMRRDKLIQAPIIGMSSDQRAAMAKANIEGLDGYLKKPINPIDLGETIRYWGQKTRAAYADYIKTQELEPIEEWPTGKVLDWEVLEQRFGNESTKELFILFKMTAPGDMQRIEKALTELDFNEMRRLVHNFKGSSSTVCAVSMTQTCLELEMTAEQADEVHCRSLLAQLNSQLKNTLEVMAEHLSSA